MDTNWLKDIFELKKVGEKREGLKFISEQYDTEGSRLEWNFVGEAELIKKNIVRLTLCSGIFNEFPKIEILETKDSLSFYYVEKDKEDKEKITFQYEWPKSNGKDCTEIVIYKSFYNYYFN